MMFALYHLEVKSLHTVHSGQQVVFSLQSLERLPTFQAAKNQLKLFINYKIWQHINIKGKPGKVN